MRLANGPTSLWCPIQKLQQRTLPRMDCPRISKVRAKATTKGMGAAKAAPAKGKGGAAEAATKGKGAAKATKGEGGAAKAPTKGKGGAKAQAGGSGFWIVVSSGLK